MALKHSGKWDGSFASIQLVPDRRQSTRNRNWPGVALGIVAMGLIADCFDAIIALTFSSETGIKMPSATKLWMKFAAVSPSPLA
jgi:hypothetical protein